MPVECVGALSGSVLINCAALVVKGLLHPEAGRRTVEQAEQGEVVVFGGFGGQLDDRSRLLEHLAAAVKHEVVVRGDECEGNGERSALPVDRYLAVLVPRLAYLPIRLPTEHLPIFKNRFVRPHEAENARELLRLQPLNEFVVGVDDPIAF